MSEKLRPDHLRRAAYIYVRQSTPQQVRDHREGQERQYALADRARALGFARVVVIDEDLGRSGSGLVDRPGFGHLLAAVCRVRPGPSWPWRPPGWPGTTGTGTTSWTCAR
jgi:hypothetical protein